MKRAIFSTVFARVRRQMEFRAGVSERATKNEQCQKNEKGKTAEKKASEREKKGVGFERKKKWPRFVAVVQTGRVSNKIPRCIAAVRT